RRVLFRSFLLALYPYGVLRKHFRKQFFAFVCFAQLEGVGEYYAFKGFIIVSFYLVVKSVLYVYSRYVVCQEYNFVGVEFILVFSGKVFFVNQAALQESGNEGSRSGKGVKDVDVLV